MAFFFFNDTATTEIYTLSLHDALPISKTTAITWLMRETASAPVRRALRPARKSLTPQASDAPRASAMRSEEHTSELQSRQYLVCRLLLEKKIIARHKRSVLRYGNVHNF